MEDEHGRLENRLRQLIENDQEWFYEKGDHEWDEEAMQMVALGWAEFFKQEDVTYYRVTEYGRVYGKDVLGMEISYDSVNIAKI